MLRWIKTAFKIGLCVGALSELKRLHEKNVRKVQKFLVGKLLTAPLKLYEIMAEQ